MQQGPDLGRHDSAFFGPGVSAEICLLLCLLACMLLVDIADSSSKKRWLGLGLLKIVPSDTVCDPLLREFSGDSGGRPIEWVGEDRVGLVVGLVQVVLDGKMG